MIVDYRIVFVIKKVVTGYLGDDCVSNGVEAMPEHDLKKVRNRIKTMGDDAAWLQQVIDNYDKDIENFRRELRESEEKATNAQKAEKKALINYEKAIDLRNGQYSELISDIFERPKEDLVRNIKKYSIIGFATTTCFAIAGILVSLYFSFGAVRDAREIGKETRQELGKISGNIRSLSASTVRDVQKIGERTHQELDEITSNIQRSRKTVENLVNLLALSDSSVMKILRQISANKKRFNNYATDNHMGLAFKIDLTRNGGPAYYDQYLVAFRIFGILREDSMSVDVLRKWDHDAIRLYEHWFEEIKELDGPIALKSSHRKWSQFATKDDNTHYGSWWIPAETLTYQKLREFIRERIDVHKKQVDKNGEIKLLPEVGSGRASAK